MKYRSSPRQTPQTKSTSPISPKAGLKRTKTHAADQAEMEQLKSQIEEQQKQITGRNRDHEDERSESGGELERIQFLLGHESVQTTERYVGCKQKLGQAVNDNLGLEDT
jgi:hypothetical protein